MISAGLVVTQLAAAVWVGAIVFQSFIVAPLVFRRLEAAQAQTFLRAVFPRFFRLGLVCGVLMLAGLAAAGDGIRPTWLLAAAAVMTATAAWSLVLIPSINAARDAGAAGATRFRRLHGLSVGLTLLNLALGVAVLVALTGGHPATGMRAGLL